MELRAQLQHDDQQIGSHRAAELAEEVDRSRALMEPLARQCCERAGHQRRIDESHADAGDDREPRRRPEYRVHIGAGHEVDADREQ